MRFGPVERRRHVVLSEVSATIAQLLSRGGNRVGAVLFDTAVEEVIAPASGRNQVLRILSRLLQEDPARGAGQAPAVPKPSAFGRWRASIRRQPPGKQAPGPSNGPDAGSQQRATSLSVPLRAALGIARRRSLIVIISDFITEPGWEQSLTQLAHRHDVVAIQVTDRREFELPAVGMIYVEDAETGEQIFIDSDDPAFQKRLREAADERQATLSAATRKAGVDLFTVSTDEDLVRALSRIAELRRRRRR
jgi:uncharacterized protein (DUF58 family)